MELNSFQRQANRTDQRPGEDEAALVFPLVGLASEVGSLLNQFKKRVRDGEAHALFSERVAEELGDVLWYVANLATKLDLELDDIAALNLRRTSERWPTGGEDEPPRLLDEGFNASEQLPRKAAVRFVQVEEDGRKRVRMYWEGRQLGHPLSDMAWDPDDYRFHDAFHLTYAAMLGWSPISRWLFDRQRRSDLRFREIEDSGRSKVIEEAVSTIAFEYAREERYLEGVKHIDFSLLQTIRNMTSRLEVRIRTVRDWERAILRSFEMRRALSANAGGTLRLDLTARCIDFSAPEL